MDLEAWRVAGLAGLMAVWWVTEVIPIPITALLPLVLLPLLAGSPIEAAASPFANPIIFLFMGGFMIAKAMERWDLHRRLAFGIITAVGTSPLRLVAGFMVAAAFLSMWVSNTAVAVMMLPIGISVIEVLRRARERDGGAGGDRVGGVERSAFPVALLLGVAYGTSIGGVATLIGTPPNAILAGFLSEEYGVRVGFARWLLLGLPLTLVLLPVTWFLLTRVVFRVDPAGPGLSAGELSALRSSLGRLRTAERRVAWVFAGTALAWMTRPIVSRWLPELSDAGIAIGAAILLFLVPAGGSDRGGLLDWEWARRIPWDVLVLFGGGLSLASAMTRSGLAEWIGVALSGAAALPLLLLLVVIAGAVVFLTEVTSNTATAAAFVPILAGLALVLGEDPFLLAAVAALASSCAFMLPVATPPNAIVFGSGEVRIQEMARAGFVLNLIVILLVPLIATFSIHFLGIGVSLP